MKTNRIALKKVGLLPLIMAALMAFILMGCQKDYPVYPERSLEAETEFTGHVTTQTFMVYPEGTEVNAFNGSIWLKFPEGTVDVPSEFTVTQFPAGHLDYKGINMYKKGIYLESEKPYQDLANVMVQVQYDLKDDNWTDGAPTPQAEENMTIYNVSPNIYAYQRINSIGDCCVDCSCKMIKGCFSGCGFYVVGEN